MYNIIIDIIVIIDNLATEKHTRTGDTLDSERLDRSIYFASEIEFPKEKKNSYIYVYIYYEQCHARVE